MAVRATRGRDVRRPREVALSVLAVLLALAAFTLGTTPRAAAEEPDSSALAAKPPGACYGLSAAETV